MGSTKDHGFDRVFHHWRRRARNAEELLDDIAKSIKGEYCEWGPAFDWHRFLTLIEHNQKGRH